MHFWLLYSTNRCSCEVLNEHHWPTCLIVQFYKHGRGLGTIKLGVEQLFINQRPDVVNSEWRSKSATLPPCQLCCSLISLVSVRTAVCIVTVQQKALVWLCPVSDISESWENNVTSGKLNPAALIIYVDALKTAHKLMSHKPWMRLAHSHMHTQNMSWCTNSILKNFKRERTHVWHLVFCPVSQGSRPVPGCAGLCRAVLLNQSRTLVFLCLVWSTAQETTGMFGQEVGHLQWKPCYSQEWNAQPACALYTFVDVGSSHPQSTDFLLVVFFFSIKMGELFLLQNVKDIYSDCGATFSRMSL